MNKTELVVRLENIRELLNRSNDLPCGEHCSTNGHTIDICFDEITHQGRTCMLRGRNFAIKRLDELLAELQ